MPLVCPCHPAPDQSARENEALTLSAHLLFSFPGTQCSDQGHLRCSSDAAFASSLSGSHRGDGQERGPLALGRRESLLHLKQVLFSQCNSLVRLVHRGSMSGLAHPLSHLPCEEPASLSYENVHNCKVVCRESDHRAGVCKSCVVGPGHSCAQSSHLPSQ